MEIPENLKTVDGIVAAMREEAKRLLESTGSDEGFSYMADLLEAAVKRERDLASLRAIHAVEMAERDARREPVPVVSRETQSAAHNAACVCQTAHDTAKLREALEKIAAWGPDPFIEPVNGDSSAIYENARSDENGKFLGREIPAWWGVAWRNDLKEFVALAKAALAAPPRNCDVGTAKEQAVRKGEFCSRYAPFADSNCDACPLRNYNRPQPERMVGYSCDLAWAQMPYDAAQEGGRT